MRFLILLLACGLTSRTALAKPLSDGVSGALISDTRPGLIQAVGQQSFTPHFGLLAGYQRETYDGDIYSGWQFGTNILLGRALAESWQANVILSAGLAGMKGPVHDHSAVWGRLDLDWESRKVLLAAAGELQRGTQMPPIDSTEFRLGYSPVTPEVNTVQPWFVLDWLARSGAGDSQVFGLLRLLNGSWWLEIGTSLSTQDRLLGFSIAL